MSGWASDPDSPSAAIGVDVYVDPGTTAGYGWAFDAVTFAPRPDVPVVLPWVGRQQGFFVGVPATPGRHRVCVYAIDLSGTPGTNPLLACRTITV